MKKIAIFLLSFLFLSGCATYKFNTGEKPYDKGYVVTRDGYKIIEYTIGKDNSVPAELSQAKERFKRRRRLVEDSYKKMGYIENRFKMAVWDPAVYFVKIVGGVFRLPSVAISDYRYRRNPQYRERIRKLEAEKDVVEEARLNKLKAKLDTYINNDLAKEPQGR